jgi:hypothetical protein
MDSTLRKDFEYYLANQDDLVQKYNGRVIVIKDGEVLGNYDTELEAIKETQKTHKVGTFLVQPVSPGKGAYAQTFHSRVAFQQ